MSVSSIEPPKTIAAIQQLVQTPAHPRFEPGVLPVFRLLVILQLGLLIIAGSVWFFFERPISPSTALQKSILGDAIAFAALAFLLVYLMMPALIQRLGRWYLPLALLVATVQPIITVAMDLQSAVSSPPSGFSATEIIVAMNWRLVAVLLIPLVLIAWQYNLRIVFAFCLISTLFDIALTYIIFPIDFASFEREWFSQHALKGARFIAFITAGFIVTRLNYEQRKQRHALREANDKLVSYAATAEQLAVSRERNRLARELHDTLAHTLSALAVQLEAVDSAWESAPDQARQLLLKSQESARSGLTETRRALQALRASPLEDLGLPLALHTDAEAAAVRTGAELTIDVPEETPLLPPDVEQGIYRIAQEALANVVKHSSSTHLSVRLTIDEEKILFLLRDNGTGFDAERILQGNERDGHYGIRGMKERAKVLGGVLDVESDNGTGTTVRLTLHPQTTVDLSF